MGFRMKDTIDFNGLKELFKKEWEISHDSFEFYYKDKTNEDITFDRDDEIRYALSQLKGEKFNIYVKPISELPKIPKNYPNVRQKKGQWRTGRKAMGVFVGH